MAAGDRGAEHQGSVIGRYSALITPTPALPPQGGG
jgi:hypothetical protein